MISPDRLQHSFTQVPAGVVQIDALITLLTNVVCFDRLMVDSRFVDTWQRLDAQLLPLADLGVVGPHDYSDLDLGPLRDAIVDELCVTPTLKQAMQKVREEWNIRRASADPHLSAVIWGGAGMLARSHLSNTPYFGHPFRRRLVSATRLFPASGSAPEIVTAFLQTQRANMFRFRGRQISGSVANFSLPPLAVKAIEDSDNIAQLIPSALNLRDQHKELREWLASYQWALDLEDEAAQIGYEKVLRDVARSLEVKYGAEKGGGTGISISTAFFKFDLPRSLVEGVRNSFGIRSTLCKLVMAPRGQKALEKLLLMLGEGRSLLGRDVLNGLRLRYS